MKLPVSGKEKVARIVYFFNAKAVIAPLLTSAPLHNDENYLFHNDDHPLVPPPATPDTREIGDINTGRCYGAASYKSFCTEPCDVLLPLSPLACIG